MMIKYTRLLEPFSPQTNFLHVNPILVIFSDLKTWTLILNRMLCSVWPLKKEAQVAKMKNYSLQ